MTSKTNIAFSKLYQLIKTQGTFVAPPPELVRMDNWAVDKYRLHNLEIQMSDGGYCQSVLAWTEDHKVQWRVDYFYPAPLVYTGITAEQFQGVAEATLAVMNPLVITTTPFDVDGY
jgi:hypothetical protein